VRYFNSLFHLNFALFKNHSDAKRQTNISIADFLRLKELERENTELKRANAILQKTASFFAQVEFERNSK
jgi:hypothetical protein